MNALTILTNLCSFPENGLWNYFHTSQQMQLCKITPNNWFWLNSIFLRHTLILIFFSQMHNSHWAKNINFISGKNYLKNNNNTSFLPPLPFWTPSIVFGPVTNFDWFFKPETSHRFMHRNYPVLPDSWQKVTKHLSKLCLYLCFLY